MGVRLKKNRLKITFFAHLNKIFGKIYSFKYFYNFLYGYLNVFNNQLSARENSIDDTTLHQ